MLRLMKTKNMLAYPSPPLPLAAIDVRTIRAREAGNPIPARWAWRSWQSPLLIARTRRPMLARLAAEALQSARSCKRSIS